jgi:hypothetical protein
MLRLQTQQRLTEDRGDDPQPIDEIRRPLARHMARAEADRRLECAVREEGKRRGRRDADSSNAVTIDAVGKLVRVAEGHDLAVPQP